VKRAARAGSIPALGTIPFFLLPNFTLELARLAGGM